MSTDKSGIAVLASLTDFGLNGKEARGVYAEETALPKPLAAAKGALQRFSQRLGVSLDGAPKEVAANLADAYRRAPSGLTPQPSPAGSSLEPGV